MQKASVAISKLQADQPTKSQIVEKYVLHSITNCVYTMLKESSEEITKHIRSRNRKLRKTTRNMSIISSSKKQKEATVIHK